MLEVLGTVICHLDNNLEHLVFHVADPLGTSVAGVGEVLLNELGKQGVFALVTQVVR